MTFASTDEMTRWARVNLSPHQQVEVTVGTTKMVVWMGGRRLDKQPQMYAKVLR